MLLTRLPLLLRGARLACVKPAASVRSEPGSNSQVENSIMTDHYVLNRREHFYMYTNRISAIVSIVLIQNVTVICLLTGQGLNLVRENPPTTFLFLLIFNCQITDIPKPESSKTSSITEPNRNPAPSASQPTFLQLFPGSLQNEGHRR